MKNIEKHDREKILEERVRVLKTFVVRLEEKLELLEQEKKGVKDTDYSFFRSFTPSKKNKFFRSEM